MTAAEERHGGGFRRGSAEEAAGGGGPVQPGAIPLHLHPGPGAQDPRPAPTAQKLRRTTQRLSINMFHIDSTVAKQHQKTIDSNIVRWFLLRSLLLFTDLLQLLLTIVRFKRHLSTRCSR